LLEKKKTTCNHAIDDCREGTKTATHNLPVVYCGSLFRTQQAVKKKKIWPMCEAMQIAAHIHSQNTDNKTKVLVQRKRTGSPLYF
jgi:hypothetical protein